MADFTADKVKQILANKPAGTTDEEIVQGLMDAGHKLLPPAKQATPVPQQPTAREAIMGKFRQAMPRPVETIEKALGPVNEALGAIPGVSAITGAGTGLARLGQEGLEAVEQSPIGQSPRVRTLTTGAKLGLATMLPQSNIESTTLAASGAMKAAGKLGQIAKGLPEGTARVASQLTSAFNRVTPNLSLNAFKNTERVFGKSETVGQVGARMGEFFKSKGVDINNTKLQQLFDTDFFPSENKTQELINTFIKPVQKEIALAKELGRPVILGEEQLIFAERAASAIQRSTAASTNKSLRQFATQTKSEMMGELEKAGFSGLQEIKTDYFDALTREAFSSVLPKNKVGSANALSTLLMSKKFIDSLKYVQEGELVKAGSALAQAAAFSPMAAGKVLKGISLLGKDITVPKGLKEAFKSSGPKQQTLREMGEAIAKKPVRPPEFVSEARVSVGKAARELESTRREVGQTVKGVQKRGVEAEALAGTREVGYAQEEAKQLNDLFNKIPKERQLAISATKSQELKTLKELASKKEAAEAAKKLTEKQAKSLTELADLIRKERASAAGLSKTQEKRSFDLFRRINPKKKK